MTEHLQSAHLGLEVIYWFSELPESDALAQLPIAHRERSEPTESHASVSKIPS